VLRPRVLAISVVLTAAALLSTLGACSSTGSQEASSDGGENDAGPLGPFFCSLPVPATCAMSAPCTFAAWGCTQPACDGYYVVTDGTWIYYYSSVGGELAGEVLASDATFVSCPYAFQPPMSCTPAIGSQCSLDGGGSSDGSGPADGNGGADANGAVDANVVGDANGAADANVVGDANGAGDGSGSSDASSPDAGD
jgi:hypothetical protein